MIGGRQELLDTLAMLHKQQHAHLYQYVDLIVGPSGLTLREAAEAMGVSHQRVAQLKKRGVEQKAAGQIIDLARWPHPAPGGKPRPTRRSVPPNAVARLAEANAKAKAYRRGHDPKEALSFYRLVESMHDEGISYRAIARTLGESERTFLRRLARWGVTQGAHSQTNVAPVARRRMRERSSDEQ